MEESFQKTRKELGSEKKTLKQHISMRASELVFVILGIFFTRIVCYFWDPVFERFQINGWSVKVEREN